MNPSTFARRGSNFVRNNRQWLSFRNVFTNLLVTALLFSLTIMALPISASMTATAAPVSTPESTNILVTVRHAPSINGLIGGSIQQLTGESVDLGWGANITEDLLVPGKPHVKVFGYPHYQGTIDGSGNILPSAYSISISGGASLRHVVRRTDPVTIPAVPEPPAPTGYRHVTINYSGQSAGNFATLDDLTVNQDGRVICVPPGTYGDFTANNTASFVFGVAGSSQPSVYNLQHLTLNDRSKLLVVGPVVLNVSGQVTVDCRATLGSTSNSSLLTLSIAHGGLEIGDHARLFGNVTSPKGLAKIDGAMYGTLTCNRLCVSNGKILKGVGGVTTPANQAPQVDAGNPQTITLPVNTVNLTGSVTDDGLPTGSTVTSTWSKVSGPGNVAFGNAAAQSTTATFSAAGEYVLQLSASDSQLSGSDTVSVTVIPQNQAPTVNAGDDQSVQLPNLATLNGSVADDGKPTGGVLTSAWSKVSGPGTVTFGNAAAPSTTASFSAPGQYVLQLSASDSQLSTSDTVTVTVIPQNQPPVVNAGADQTVQLPNLANLNGTVSDDGLPTGTVTSTWTTVSGPGTVTFGNANSPSTTAKFSAPGDYVLRLTASDSLLSSSDDVNITAQPSVPVVNAGPDQTITLPSVGQLNGSADDGVNPPASLTYQWSMVSGPAAVSFGNANSAVTTVSFTQAGSYVLSLSASNGQNTGSDDITINVNAGCINAPSGLAGWWQGEGNANDASLNNNDGQVINNVSFNAGKVGQAFTFNGTNSVRIPDSPSLRPATFTVDAWVRFDSLDTPGAGAPGLQFLVFKRNSIPNSFESFALAKLRVNGVDNFVFTMKNATQSALLTSSTAIVAGQFYHVAGTFDGTIMRMYVNGVNETLLAPGFGPDYGTSPVVFGSTGESFDGKLTGALDEVHLFNRALSDTEIQEIFLTSNFGLCGPPSVDAGMDQTLNLPASTVNLSGSATDPNNPGGVLSLNWSVASGPGAVVFGNSSSMVSGNSSTAVTTASFSVPGTYVLRLRATNGSLSSCDTVIVKVMPPCDQPPSGLAGWWRGEGNAHDSAGQGDGVLVNGTTFTSAEVGQGFQFNGTNSVVIPDSPSLKPSTFTLDTWVRFDSLDTPGAGAPGLQFLIFKRNSIPNSFESFALAKLRVNGVDNFVFTMKNATQSALLISTTVIVPGQFYHVAGTFDGTIMRMYVNGVNETLLVPGFGPDHGTSPVVFGSTGEAFDGKLTGVMDEVHIFNRALSDAEVQSIFASASSGICTSAMNRIPVFNSGSVAATTIALNMSPTFGGKLFDQNRSFVSRTRPAAREVAEKVTGFGTF